jgi:VWFA-related protein
MKLEMRNALSLGLLLTMAPVLIVAQGNNTIRSETKVVLVDAVITDKKGYVHNLTAKDFEVFEDDKKQTVTSFSSEADPAGASKAQARYVILIFDDSNADNSDQRRARDAAARFVQANAGPDRMIAIANFRGTLQVVQNFTDDAARLKTVLGGTAPSTLSLSGSAPGLISAASSGAAGSLLLAVRNLARDLASVPGRKTLVLLSADSQLRAEEHGAEISAALDACNRANVAIYGVDTRGFSAVSAPGFDGRGAAFPTPRGTLATGGLDCNPGLNCQEPLADADNSRNQQAVLRMLSTGSGGFMIGNTNDLAAGLEKIGQEQNEYYLIGYTPPDSPEGSCHKLRVKVDRGGTSVRSRAGYCNARSSNALAGSTSEKDLESLPASPPGGSNAWLEAGFFYTPGDTLARVNLAMEIPLKKMKTEKEQGKLRATVHVLGIARRPDGSVAARFSENVALEFDDEKRLAAFLAAPFHYENQFEIVPGSYALDVAYDAGDESRGKVEAPLVVDAYQPAQFAISGLVLSRQYGPVSDPRLHTDGTWTADRTPLIAEGMRIVPSGSNRFKKTDAPVVYAEIYEPLLGPSDPKSAAPDPKVALGVGVSMRIYDLKTDRKTGEQKLDTGIVQIKLPSATGNNAIPITKRVPIDSLAPGSYRLELEATDSAGKSARRTVDFEVEE